MFKLIQRGARFVDGAGVAVSVTRSTPDRVFYRKDGEIHLSTCPLDVFQREFEPLDRVEDADIRRDIEYTQHIASLRQQAREGQK